MRKPIVTIEEFQEYSGNFEDSHDSKHLKLNILLSAQQVVEDYLGYKLEANEFEDDFIGVGMKKVFLNNRPICHIHRVRVDGRELPFTDYKWDDECLILKKEIPSGKEIVVNYSAGTDDQPALIKQTILRIATLMLMECGENIGLTGKSFDNNTKTFINYTNYSKYLAPIEQYRVWRI